MSLQPDLTTLTLLWNPHRFIVWRPSALLSFEKYEHKKPFPRVSLSSFQSNPFERHQRGLARLVLRRRRRQRAAGGFGASKDPRSSGRRQSVFNLVASFRTGRQFLQPGVNLTALWQIVMTTCLTSRAPFFAFLLLFFFLPLHFGAESHSCLSWVWIHVTYLWR